MDRMLIRNNIAKEKERFYIVPRLLLIFEEILLFSLHAFCRRK